MGISFFSFSSMGLSTWVFFWGDFFLLVWGAPVFLLTIDACDCCVFILLTIQFLGRRAWFASLCVGCFLNREISDCDISAETEVDPSAS